MAPPAIPEWLSRVFLEKVLRRSISNSSGGGGEGDEDGGLNVYTMTMRPVAEEGEVFTSAVHRVTCKTSQGQQFLIVKTMPADELTRHQLRQGHVFRRESVMLTSIIPELRRALAGRRTPSALAPKCVYTGAHPEEMILEEDLSRKGFVHAGRRSGLDLAHARLVLRTLALFHAASAYYLKRSRGAASVLGNPYALLLDKFNQSARTSYHRVADKCREWTGFEAFADPIRKSAEDAAVKLAHRHAYEPGSLNVISHGDLWLNNLMFKYDEGEVKEVRFVDFQMSHVTTPAADLLYFFATSVSKEVFQTWDRLVAEYHETLFKAMASFNLKPPPLETLQECLDKSGIIAVNAALVVAPMAKTALHPHAERALQHEGSANSTLLDSDDVKDWLQMVLKEVARRGWLDVPGFGSSTREPGE